MFGDWNTIYEGLSQLPEPVQTSWFAFDHYYSDRAFPSALRAVFNRPIARLLDVGGNTGKWALQCVTHDPQVHVTILDLPGQLQKAKRNIDAAGMAERVECPGDRPAQRLGAVAQGCGRDLDEPVPRLLLRPSDRQPAQAGP